MPDILVFVFIDADHFQLIAAVGSLKCFQVRNRLAARPAPRCPKIEQGHPSRSGGLAGGAPGPSNPSNNAVFASAHARPDNADSLSTRRQALVVNDFYCLGLTLLVDSDLTRQIA